MTAKRFTIPKEYRVIKDNVTDECATFYDVDDGEMFLKWLNELHEENNSLRLMLNSCSDQRDEFHRGARENANRVGKLVKENEELKKALLFFYDVANCECSTNWKGDMEKGCKKFFNCTYEEAKSKYGNYDGMWWEIND